MTPDEFKTIRKAVGLTQARLAKVIGCDVRTIRYYESNMRTISRPIARMMKWFKAGFRPPEW